MDQETKDALAALENKFVGLLQDIKKSNDAGGTKHGPHAVGLCPICELPARKMIENDGVTFTCRACGGLSIKYPAVVLNPGDPEKFVEHGKIEALMSLHGTKDLRDVILVRDADGSRKIGGDAAEILAVVKRDKRDKAKAQDKGGARA